MFVLTYQNPDEQDATSVIAVSDDARALESAALRHLTSHACGDTFALVWRNRRGLGRVGRIREDGSDMCDFYEIKPVQVV